MDARGRAAPAGVGRSGGAPPWVRRARARRSLPPPPRAGSARSASSCAPRTSPRSGCTRRSGWSTCSTTARCSSSRGDLLLVRHAFAGSNRDGIASCAVPGEGLTPEAIEQATPARRALADEEIAVAMTSRARAHAGDARARARRPRRSRHRRTGARRDPTSAPSTAGRSTRTGRGRPLILRTSLRRAVERAALEQLGASPRAPARARTPRGAACSSSVTLSRSATPSMRRAGWCPLPAWRRSSTRFRIASSARDVGTRRRPARGVEPGTAVSRSLGRRMSRACESRSRSCARMGT